MRHTILGLALLSSLALAACGDQDAAPGAAGENSEEGAAANEVPSSVELKSFGDAKVSGTANFEAQGKETSVALQVRGGAPDKIVEAHIHEGTCEQQGNVVYPLDQVKLSASGEGTSTSTVAAALETLAAKPHYVQVHTPGENPGPPTACGNLPSAGAEEAQPAQQ